MSDDPQCAQLYRAERDVYRQVPPRAFRNLDAVVRFVNRVVNSDWYHGPDHVIIEDYGRGYQPAVATVWQGVGHIRLPRWAWDKITVLHELAHLSSNRGQDHGPAFARRFLEGQERFNNRETYYAFVDAYERRGVRTR